MALSKEVKNNLASFMANRTSEQVVLDSAMPHATESGHQFSGSYSLTTGIAVVKGGDDLLHRLGYSLPVLSTYDKRLLRPYKSRWNPEMDPFTNKEAIQEQKKHAKLERKERLQNARLRHPTAFSENMDQLREGVIDTTTNAIDPLSIREQRGGAYIINRLATADTTLSEFVTRNELVSPEAEQLAARVDQSFRKKDGEVLVTKNQEVPKDDIRHLYTQAIDLLQSLQPVQLDGKMLPPVRMKMNQLHNLDPKTIYFDGKYITIYSPGNRKEDPSQRLGIYIEESVDVRCGTVAYSRVQIGNDTSFSYEDGVRLDNGVDDIHETGKILAVDRFVNKKIMQQFKEKEGLLQELFSEYL